MRIIHVFFGAVAMGLLGMSFAWAEIRSNVNPLSFEVGQDGTMQSISFDAPPAQSGEEAAQTCNMTPGGSMPDIMMQQTTIPPRIPEELRQAAPEAFAAINSTRTTPSTPNTPYIPDPPPETPPGDDPEDPPVVPAPATLVIVGLGLGAMAVARRWKKV